jgi:uncharacterized protein YyaL (SSP411 family)
MALQLITILVVCSLGVLPVASQDGADTAGPDFSKLLDFSVPVQTQFEEWPPDELVERPYWFPFSEQSFFRAGLFGKPVFLFIDSRWNHHAHQVREELLGDPEILRRLNEEFLTVYVNIDSRPDIQERYQTGTMPVMSLLLPTGDPMISKNTPTGEGMPITIGNVDKERMMFLLEHGALYYDLKPRFLTHIGQQWAISEIQEEPISGPVNLKATDLLVAWIHANWDRDDGGVGLAPKYVLPGMVEFAQLRAARGEPDMSSLTRGYLPSLVGSPLHDTRHGGIHRVAGAPEWGNIEYEKLLDRNSLFLRELLIGMRESDDPALRSAAEGAARFIMETLATPEGWFQLGQTADFGSETGGGYWIDPARAGETPPVDPLVLSGPVVQAGAALLRAGVVLGKPAMELAGRKAIEAVLKAGYSPGRGVRHVLAPHPSERIYLETQADVAFYLLDAYEVTGERRWLEISRDLVDYCGNNMRLQGDTLYRDHFPAAEPVGLMKHRRSPHVPNIRLVRTMMKLWHHGAGPRYGVDAEDLLAAYAGDLSIFRIHGIQASVAVEEIAGKPLKITLYGEPGTPVADALRKAAIRSKALAPVVISAPPAEDGSWPEPRAEVSQEDESFSTSDPQLLLERIESLTRSRSARNGS